MENYVNGWWKTNLGDDLFLHIICERYRNQSFFITCEKEEMTVFQHLNNLKIIEENKSSVVIKLFSKFLRVMYFWIPLSVLKEWIELFFLRKRGISDKNVVVIEIGGSIFMMPKRKDISMTEGYFLRNIELKNFPNYYVVGSNFGPFYFQEQVDKYKELFSKMQDVCFRDTYSKKLFPNLDTVRSATDVVMSLKIEDYQQIPEKKQIIISVIDVLSKKDTGLEGKHHFANKYEKFILSVTEDYVKKGYKVVLFSFCDFQNDHLFSQKIFNQLNKTIRSNVELFSHKQINKSLSKIAESEKIIATRFHAMILGWLFQKPTFVISYSQKTTQVIENSFNKQTFVDYNKVEKLNLNNMDDYFVKIDDLTKEYLINDAQNQFRGLDSLLQS